MTAPALVERELLPGDLVKRLPTLDSYRASEISLAFSGSTRLDHLNALDLELVQAARLGAPVRLIVTGTISAKRYALETSSEGLKYTFTVKVDGVEDAERA